MPEPVSELKKSLRRQLREARRAIDPDIRSAINAAINVAILQHVARHSFEAMAAFWPFDDEPDLRPVLHALDREGVTIALPVIPDNERGALAFHAWTTNTQMTLNRYGIPEPKEGARMELQELDLVLVPLVGWDRRGNRLGMGGGFYDRTLNSVGQTGQPILAGVAWAAQEQPAIPVDERDVSLHAVITEQGWFIIPPGD